MLNAKSTGRLEGVHPDLVKVVKRAAELCDTAGLEVQITEGLRNIERQQFLYQTGKSRTMNSRHLTGHAVDIAIYMAGTLTWSFPVFKRASRLFYQAAQELGVDIDWGGDFDEDGRSDDEKLVDGPHFELNRKKYP